MALKARSTAGYHGATFPFNIDLMCPLARSLKRNECEPILAMRSMKGKCTSTVMKPGLEDYVGGPKERGRSSGLTSEDELDIVSFLMGPQ